MANSGIDIFSPSISTVSNGIEGKLILLHSNERKLGKTAQAVRFPKPYYLRFEQGINAIAGLAYAPLTKWSDFKKVNKQLTDPKTLDKARAMYSTIIVDTLDVAIKWCEKYVCGMQGVARLNDGNSGYGLWKEYENEWFGEWNKLLNAGYCIVFISHSEERKMIDPKTNEEYVQLYPKGDKRTIDLIIDAVDLIGYVKSNGFDENGNPQMSSVYFANCPQFLAGGRFKYMAPEITPFTAEAVQEALKEAVEKESQESGIQAVDYSTFKAESTVKQLTYEEAMEQVKPLYKKLYKVNKDKTIAIVEKYLGEGNKISETNEAQTEQIIMIIDDLRDALDEVEE